jgi:hypothetical protein
MKKKSCKRGTIKKCLRIKTSYEKQLDCQCPFCMSAKKYQKCVSKSRLSLIQKNKTRKMRK